MVQFFLFLVDPVWARSPKSKIKFRFFLSWALSVSKWNFSSWASKIEFSLCLTVLIGAFVKWKSHFIFENSQERLWVCLLSRRSLAVPFLFSKFVSFLLEKQRFIFVKKKSLQRRKHQKPSFAAKPKTLGIFKEPFLELSVTLQLVKTTKVFIKIDCFCFVFW